MTFPPLVPDLAAHTEAARHDAHMHHHAAGYVRSDEQSRGRCGWRWEHEDVVIYCWAPDTPGFGLCIPHLAAATNRTRRGTGRKVRCPRYAFTSAQLDAFWSQVDKDGPRGCWIWTGPINHLRGGYGAFSANKNSYRAHVLAYRLTAGPIPEGLHLDHLCRNRVCCNPAHLEPVTPLENARRGIGGQAARERHAKQTHCKHGHEYTPENTIIAKAGTPAQQRLCRICRSASDRRHKDRLIAERAAARQAREVAP